MSSFLHSWLLASADADQPAAAALPAVPVASPEQVLGVLKSNRDAVILDARRASEIVEGDYVNIPGRRWVYASCSLEECSLLEKTAESLVPDKKSTLCRQFNC